jgi:hypothetical protein
MKKSSKMSNCDAYPHTYNGNLSQSYSTFGDNNTDANQKTGFGAMNNINNNISNHTCISNTSNTILTQRTENILPLQFD